MIDGVDAGDGIEAGIGEGQLCGRIGNPKSSALGQSALRGERVGCCNCLFMNVNSDDRTAGASRDSQHRASRSASNVEQGLARRKIEPAQKLVLFVRCKPAALSNILAESIATNLGIQVGLKIAVVGVVMTTGRRQSGWNRFVHLIPRRTRCPMLLATSEFAEHCIASL